MMKKSIVAKSVVAPANSAQTTKITAVSPANLSAPSPRFFSNL